jgi:hypothetical protein
MYLQLGKVEHPKNKPLLDDIIFRREPQLGQEVISFTSFSISSKLSNINKKGHNINYDLILKYYKLWF